MPTDEQDREAKGIAAIIFLQSSVGIVEPEEKARRGWRGMTEREREITLNTHQMMLAHYKAKRRENRHAH